MRYFERQKRLEEKTYDIINEISDELDLDVPCYPEVYWVGRKLFFESLGLENKFEKHFEDVKKNNGAVYFSKEKVILICNDKNYVIAEEAGHFLNYVNAKPNFRKIEKNNNDSLAFQIISESLGYFCSKLINSSRKPLYKDYNNFEEFASEFAYGNKNLEKEILGNGELKRHFIIYKEGYDLGESLFNHYISDLIEANKIKDLMLLSFEENYSATKKFFELKYKYLNKDKA